ncbi:hypothetical protein ACFE04_011974 [Oxalis oulophora]
MAPELVLQLLCTFLFTASHLVTATTKTSTYVIHMDLAAMPISFSGHHDWFSATLTSVSPKAKPLYTYTNSIHGFAATLTKNELEGMKKKPGYVSFTCDQPLTLHTTHTSQFLGLSSTSAAWPASNYGEGVIIGVVDTGVWPESESFSDNGMAKVTSKWKGKCEFNGSLCNNKLIGARFFNRGLLASKPKAKISLNSPRDEIGHGTHTSSTAAGNYVKGASYFGYAPGTARGMAPRAHIAMYKAAWREGGYASDIVAAIDQAISDGVDILSLSLGLAVDGNFLSDDPIAVATFAAVQKGVVVVASSGNDGPFYWTTTNGAPWILSVGAGTTDREFKGILTLSSGVQLPFASLYPGNFSLNQIPIIFMNTCENVKEMKKVQNKIIVCRDIVNIKSKIEKAISAGVLGAVFITADPSVEKFYIRSSMPTAFLSLQDGEKVLNYVKQRRNPTASFRFRKTSFGTKPAPKVERYSSRGPFLTCPNILKPDILAPGTLILASWSPQNPVAKIHFSPVHSKFNLVSGTSMAAPHIAGLTALVKKAYPDWSPAAIRSALMTTANNVDNTLSPIKNIGFFNNFPVKASPLDMGAGHVNPNKAINPGLIYDTTVQDYVNLLCAMKYSASQIRTITRSVQKCENRDLDLNYPSFIAFFNNEDETAQVTGMDGVKVKVEPEKLVFGKKYEKQSYKLTLEGPKLLRQEVVHGSLIWVDDDGRYLVRSPIVVTSLVAESS